MKFSWSLQAITLQMLLAVVSWCSVMFKKSYLSETLLVKGAKHCLVTVGEMQCASGYSRSMCSVYCIFSRENTRLYLFLYSITLESRTDCLHLASRHQTPPLRYPPIGRHVSVVSTNTTTPAEHGKWVSWSCLCYWKVNLLLNHNISVSEWNVLPCCGV